MIVWIFIIGFLLFLLVLAPVWPYSRGWSFYPSGTIAVLLVLLLLFWTFRAPAALGDRPLSRRVTDLSLKGVRHGSM